MYYVVYNGNKIVVDESGKALKIHSTEDAYITDINNQGYKPVRGGDAAYSNISGYINEHGETVINGQFSVGNGTASWTYNNVQYSLSAGVVTPTLDELP